VRQLVLIAGLIAVPCGAISEVALPPEKLGVFLAAIVENGCRMTSDEAESKLPAVGIGKEESQDIAQFLIASGSAEVVDDTLTLSKENCP
jgi:hypothetical protein